MQQEQGGGGKSRRVFLPCLSRPAGIRHQPSTPNKQEQGKKRNHDAFAKKTKYQRNEKNKNLKKKIVTDLQASLRAVGLLSLPRRVLGTTLSTNGLSFSSGHDGKRLIEIEKVASNRVNWQWEPTSDKCANEKQRSKWGGRR